MPRKSRSSSVSSSRSSRRSSSSSRSSSKSTPSQTSSSNSAPTPVKAAAPPAASSANVPAKTSTSQAPVPTPAQTPAPIPTQSNAPGLLGQAASTAAGVAIGHSIGHGITSLFSRGSSSTDENLPLPAQEGIPPQPSYDSKDNSNGYRPFQPDELGNGCEADARALTKCLEQNKHDINACQWYLENLKACQQMASQYQ